MAGCVVPRAAAEEHAWDLHARHHAKTLRSAQSRHSTPPPLPAAPVQGGQQAMGRDDDGAAGHARAALHQRVDVVARDGRLADGARAQVHHLHVCVCV